MESVVIVAAGGISDDVVVDDVVVVVDVDVLFEGISVSTFVVVQHELDALLPSLLLARRRWRGNLT